MTATSSFKIYEILQHHFKNEIEAKIVVQEIETIIDNKYAAKSNIIASKEDIGLIRQDLLKFQVDVEKRFNQMIICTVSTGITVVGILIPLIKLK
jgi:hypothetical protein